MILLKIENTFESKNDRKILIKSADSTPDKTPGRPSVSRLQLSKGYKSSEIKISVVKVE